LKLHIKILIKYNQNKDTTTLHGLLVLHLSFFFFLLFLRVPTWALRSLRKITWRRRWWRGSCSSGHSCLQTKTISKQQNYLNAEM
jgi:isopentenyldiphosphate isomerase